MNGKKSIKIVVRIMKQLMCYTTSIYMQVVYHAKSWKEVHVKNTTDGPMGFMHMRAMINMNKV